MRALQILTLTGFFVLPATGQSISEITNYYEMCDASAALAVNDEHFIMANDEDNILRIYHINKKNPVSTIDLSSFFKTRYDDKSPESDIEGAARINDYYFFITSHGRDRKGRLRKNRHQFFAVKVDPQSLKISPVGMSYQGLMDAIVHINAVKKLGVYDSYQPRDKKNARLAPKKQGVNIEGLAAAPNGSSLLIAFRNPVPYDKALVVELLNPFDVVMRSQSPKFGKTVLLSMNKRGIRSLEYCPRIEQYLVVGEAVSGKDYAKLYLWDEKKGTYPQEIKAVDFIKMNKFNPEAIAIYPQKDRFQIFSDDGTIEHVNRKGKTCPCKELSPVELRTYRGLWIDSQVLLK